MRLRLLKIAVRVQETASRIRLAFASGCPEADLVRRLAAPSRPAQSSLALSDGAAIAPIPPFRPR